MHKLLKINPVLRFYWRHTKRYPFWLRGILVSIPIIILVNNYLPSLILASILSRLAAHDYQSHAIWASFGPELIAYAALLLGGIGLWRVADYFMWRLETHIQRDLAEEVFEHLMSETADFHANRFSGTLVSHTNKLIGSYVRIADTFIFQTYPLIAGVIIASLLLASRAPLFVIVLLVLVGFYLVVAFRASKPVSDLSARYATIESQQTGFLADAVSNAMAIKSFGRSAFERQRFSQATGRTQQALQAFANRHQRQMNTLGFANRLISAGSLVMAVIGVLLFNAEIGTVFLIFNYTANIVDQLFQFSNNGLRNYNRAFGDAADMIEILAQKPAILDPTAQEPIRMNRGLVEFRHVTFTHNGADDAIFEDLNVRLKPGEKIGLVGHSGSGKTTLTRLLLRFSDIDGGEIVIDGQNITAVAQDDLRSRIAYVPQEPLLFHRTIAENIGYGDLSADRQAIEAIAKLANAHDFIVTLPKGYDTLVGERGVKLSGGQRQRVAIARAMLKNAPILALDEATSALDSESEALIQDALWRLMEGRTAIVIAHRLSTIQRMDRIIVLADGKIVEQGSHKELLHTNGTYAKLWERQSGGFMEE